MLACIRSVILQHAAGELLESVVQKLHLVFAQTSFSVAYLNCAVKTFTVINELKILC